MKTRLLILTIVVLAVVLGGYLILQKSRPVAESGPGGRAITIFCAAGVKIPLEAVAEAFIKETGKPLKFQFGGTATLLSQLRVSAGAADLFISADAVSIAEAKNLGLIAEMLPFGKQTPVIAVAKGNPRNISSLGDLLNDGVRFAIANPESASVGKLSKMAFGSRWEEAKAKAAVMKFTVPEIAADLTVGSVDAAIVWDATVEQFKGLEAVHTQELDALAEPVTVAVTTSSQAPADALMFARFLAAPEKGNPLLKANGLTPLPGDTWATRPELIVYSGSVNRPAVEGLLRVFSEREGVDITTVFNGCGILCAAMETMKQSANPKFPDLYYACDMCFVPPVAEDFQFVTPLTETDIGIVVPKANPYNVRTLQDLTRSGLRVGLCNVKQSTLGYMTGGILAATGLEEAVRKNVVSEVPTADLLVNQLRTGSLDAAIVYRVNVHLHGEVVSFFPIDHPGAKAVQPVSVWKKSPRSQLANRLKNFLIAHPQDFEKAGFRWLGELKEIQSSSIELPPWLKLLDEGPEPFKD